MVAWKPAKYATEFPGLDACKVAHASAADLAESEGKNRHADFGSGPREHNGVYAGMPAEDRAQYDGGDGRWPPNVVLTHRPEAARSARGQSGQTGITPQRAGLAA